LTVRYNYRDRMTYKFGPFCYDAEQRLLFREGELVPLVPKALETLHVLLEHRGRVVEKSELMTLVWPDTHVEDVGLAFGLALSKALGDRKGIRRFGYAIVPMDDALALSAVDLVRRPYSSIQLKLERTMLEDAPKEDLEHFIPSLTTTLEATVHVRILDGSNDHHKFEAAFKAFALAFREAIQLYSRRSEQLPTSKGMM
jgi:imidazoleglycerol phosphate dehydratase HisB